MPQTDAALLPVGIGGKMLEGKSALTVQRDGHGEIVQQVKLPGRLHQLRTDRLPVGDGVRLLLNGKGAVFLHRIISPLVVLTL